MAVCPNCNERGKIFGPPWGGILQHWKTCPSCGGTGKVTGYWRKCKICEGWGDDGEIIPSLCQTCNGRGIVRSRSERPDKPRRGRSVHIHFD